MAINLWIWSPPTYKESISRRVFGKPDISGTLPMSTSSIYIDFNMNLFAIDMQYYRIQKTPQDIEYSDTIMKIKPTPVAIIGDEHANLYTIDTQSSLIIYNSTGDVINIMNNTLDNPRYSDYWEHTYMGDKNEDYIPDYFATIALD